MLPSSDGNDITDLCIHTCARLFAGMCVCVSVQHMVMCGLWSRCVKQTHKPDLSTVSTNTRTKQELVSLLRKLNYDQAFPSVGVLLVTLHLCVDLGVLNSAFLKQNSTFSSPTKHTEGEHTHISRRGY